MTNNKKAKKTLALIANWDDGRPASKRLNNKVVVSLESSREFYLLGGWVKGSKNKVNPRLKRLRHTWY